MRKAEKLLRRGNEARFAGFDSSISSASHDVVAKAAFGIVALLLNLHAIRRKRHGDFAFCGVAGNECRDVADDVGVAHSFADIRIAGARHPLAIELNAQFVMAKREDSELVPVIAIDAVDLSGSDDLMFRWGLWRSRCWWILPCC